MCRNGVDLLLAVRLVMASQEMARVAVWFMSLAILAAVQPAHGQTSLGHGQHVARYGSGYVGNAPNTIPMTSYYRSPAITAYGQPAVQQPVTSYFAPNGVAPAGYSPAVSYRVGTPNAAAYSSAYSPIVTPTTPYAANWQYPPQTVMPTVANYAPVPPAYTTNYANVPVTYYRPVTVLSPSGTPQTVLQPCTGAECQAQRRHTGFFGWLFHHNQAPAAPCTSGYCGQPAAVPYYTPGPAAIGTPLGTSSTIPANVAPTLSGPPVVGGSTTTIPPNTSITPGTSIFGSGGTRADYPPADAYYPPATSFPPNVSLPAAPAGELRSVSPPQTNGNGSQSNGSESNDNGSEPADQPPVLNRPANAPVGNGVQENNGNGNGGGIRPPLRRPNQRESEQEGAVLRRDDSITPIPDPEYTRGTRTKMKAPQLLKPTRDRTAQVTPSETRLAAFEQETPAVKPAAPAPRKVLGDEIWRSAK
jgi:hypothetical protein